ncbi:MAG: GNAT family N-acetyltransferase [Christensenellales bacterium]
MCVLKEYRGMGIGDALIRLLMDRALEVGAPALFLSAQEPLKGMYEKYGFEQIGDAYQEGQIPHVKMTVKADEVQFRAAAAEAAVADAAVVLAVRTLSHKKPKEPFGALFYADGVLAKGMGKHLRRGDTAQGEKAAGPWDIQRENGKTGRTKTEKHRHSRM